MVPTVDAWAKTAQGPSGRSEPVSPLAARRYPERGRYAITVDTCTGTVVVTPPSLREIPSSGWLSEQSVLTLHHL